MHSMQILFSQSTLSCPENAELQTSVLRSPECAQNPKSFHNVGSPCSLDSAGAPLLSPAPEIHLDARVCYIKAMTSGELFKQSSKTAGSPGAYERQKARPHFHSSRTSSCLQRDSLGVASPRIIIGLFGSSD